MNSFLSNAASILERRFLKNAFIPVLLLPIGVALPWALQGNRLSMLTRLWQTQSAGVKLIESALYLAFTWFIASIAASQWRNIIRLFEGYPLRRIPWLAKICEDHYRRIAEKLESRGDRWNLYYNYPISPGDFLATRLGNVIIAAERHSYDRYGADAIVIWPRLYHLLPREFVDDLEDARASVEFLLVISLWFVLAGAGSLTLLVGSDAPFPMTLYILLISVAGSYGSYLSSIRAATEFGEQLRSGMELYRLQLLDFLRMPRPTDVHDEIRSWGLLLDLIGSNQTQDFPAYVDQDPPSVVVRLPDLFP
jgi:hypothetical protein